jgi:hypothetical protein
LHALTIRRATEWHGGIFKRATRVSIQTAPIAVVPEALSTANSHWGSITWYIGCKGTLMQNQGEAQNPGSIKSYQQAHLLFSFREEGVYNPERGGLNPGQEWLYLPRP